MERDPKNKFRSLFAEKFNDFPDRVDDPWKQNPDCVNFNRRGYEQISRQLTNLQRDQRHRTKGLLILGAAGAGKTHLLMRVAQKLSTVHENVDSVESHILFVRKPNVEEAVAQHIWDNMVTSLNRSLNDEKGRTQLDTMLAHVFSAVLIPQFKQDADEGKDADQKRRWSRLLETDPYNLFDMSGEGEQRRKNLNLIRRRTLRFLKENQAEVDQTIAHVLITYCLVNDLNRKRSLLEWLRGKEIEEDKAKELGLPSSWVASDETSGDAAVQQMREKYALKAIQTIGILSTYYRPLILAFDQLEGLRGKELLTQNWGDTVREIFTMTPNLLILTCIFPDLWETWFSPTLDQSVSERIAQTRIDLEPFSADFGMNFLEVYMKPWYQKFRLPTSIYPFTQEDIRAICVDGISPRRFLQEINRKLQDNWLWTGSEEQPTDVSASPAILRRQDIGAFIGKRLIGFKENQMREWERSIPIENDYFGRIKTVLDMLVEHCAEVHSRSKAEYEKRVMPLNVVFADVENSSTVCFGVMNGIANSFAARIKNFLTVSERKDQFSYSMLFRDKRCSGLGNRSREYIDLYTANGGVFYELDQEEGAFVNAVYDTLTAIEEHDMTLGSHQVDKREFVDYLFITGELAKYGFFRKIFDLLPPLKQLEVASAVSPLPILPVSHVSSSETIEMKAEDNSNPFLSDFALSDTQNHEDAISESGDAVEDVPPFSADIVIGNKALDVSQSGLVGKLINQQKTVAFSFSKPMCALVVGYMGSGKSYALGVLMENALLNVDHLTWNPRPTCVVAFNYRKNAASRFEYGTYTQPNNRIAEVKRLTNEYGAMPKGIDKINVLAFAQELSRRKDEYGNATLYPIQFLSNELSVEHWEILMKPPTANAEYMNIVRDVIQKLHCANRLSFENLERAVEDDDRLSQSQRQRVGNRLSFAKTWISDKRGYQWSDVFEAGTLTVFDLRMQALVKEDALRLCLIITDIVRKTKNEINKTIIFDEAHEYANSKELSSELENAITQIRHDGLSFVLATQFPDGIPRSIMKYLSTRIIFKIPDLNAIKTLRSAAPNLSNLSPYQVSNLNTEAGECFVQTDDDCSDPLLRKPQLCTIRPRCSLHGGTTKRS